jgi:hypothetical protein
MTKQAWTVSEKIALIAEICGDKRMSFAKRVGAITLLARFHNTTNGDCFPSLDQWGKAFGAGKSTAVRTAQIMEQLGYMTADHSDGGRNKRTTYSIKKTVSPADRLERETVSPADPGCVTSGPARVSPADPQVSSELYPIGGANAPGAGKDTIGKKQRANESLYWRDKDGLWRIRYEAKQYGAWRKHAERVHDWNLYYRFPNNPGHVAVAASLWPPRG